MNPVLAVAFALAPFVATHLGLAWPPLRQRLVARLGRMGFTIFYSLVAWFTFGFAVSVYAAHAGEGQAGLALGTLGPARALLVATIALGIMLMTGSFAGYATSPYAMSRQQERGPRGLERVTRHPFFVGVSLLGVAHALLATRLVGAVFMGILGAYALIGARLQDAKLAALRGDSYARFAAASSILPFAAITAGRQRLVLSELPYGAMLLGLAVTAALRALHDRLFADGGAWLIAALVIGPLVVLFDDRRRARRAHRLAATSALG
ncbi:MAG: hypothetical protein E6J87_01570 [Deltaproteobacteria bacterium]|nr:MAG: hypothetical protein E6J87_01570 [Deltaproteobacteria bacterium]